MNLTMPLAALFRDGREAGEVPGYGFLPAADCRALAAAQTKARWCLTLTGADGRAVAHGCATGQTGSPAAGQRR